MLERLVAICSVFGLEGAPWNIIFLSEVQATRTYYGRPSFLCSQADLKRACRRGRLEAYYGRPSFLCSQADLKRACRRGRLEAIGCQGWTVVGKRHGAKSLAARTSTERLVASAISNREDPRFLDIVYLSFIYHSMVCWFQSLALVLL